MKITQDRSIDKSCYVRFG